jgi:N-acetylmuramoyl-L-alanine amidase
MFALRFTSELRDERRTARLSGRPAAYAPAEAQKRARGRRPVPHGERGRLIAVVGRRTLNRCALVLLAAVAGWLLYPLLVPGRPAAHVICPGGHPVVIDPGHGGIDGGAGGGGMLEKEIVLDIALRTERLLLQAGVPVLLTRAIDVDLGGANDRHRHRRDLQYRTRLANECRASLLVSLHVNSSRTPAESGMLIFYQHGSAPSRDAGVFLMEALRRSGLHSRQEPAYANRRFHVLRASKAPAVLVELGFITNAGDRAKLAREEYREQVAQRLASVCRTLFQNWIKAGSM